MKGKNLLQSVLMIAGLMAMSFVGWSQGNETFNNFTATGTTYSNGTFQGQDGSTWTYVQCRGDYEITGKAIMIGRNRDPQSNFYSGTISNGIGQISFDYMQAFTNNVNLNILVNDVVVGNVTSSAEQGVIKSSGPITVNVANNVVIKFISVTNNDGQVVVDNIIWTAFGGGTPQVATPTFSPAGGTFYQPVNVSIATATQGATIYYTTNGTNPTTSSTLYSNPFTVSVNTTVKAFAVKDDMDDSEIATAVFSFTEAPDVDLFISEYLEGSSNNKALEIYNPTNQTVDLSLYVVKSANNGNGWGNTSTGPDTRYVLPLTGTLAPGEVLVLANAAANEAILAVADYTYAYDENPNGSQGSNVLAFNGDDAIGLFKNETLIDVIGIPTEDPGTNWLVAGTGATSEFTLVRKGTVDRGNIYWTTSAGSNADDSEWVVYPQNTSDYLGWHLTGFSDEAEIVSFSVPNQLGAAQINSDLATVTLQVLYGTNVSAVIPQFALSSGATAFIGEVQQVSGASVVNFSNPVVYAVIAEDETTQKDWTVTVNVGPMSSQAEILNFEVNGQMGSAVINSDLATVSIQVALGTDVTNLTPSITISLGATINPAGGVAQDFSSPVNYTVTAQDGTTQKVWTVTVGATNIIPIHDIQFTDHPSGDSPYALQVVTTTGIVTAWHYNYEGGTFQGIFIQDGVGAWNGIYVYNGLMDPKPAVGDQIVISGMIKEYYGLTELTFDTPSGVNVEYEIMSSGNDLPLAEVVSTLAANNEAYEGVLIKTMDVLCTEDDLAYGMAEINDGSGPLKVDDDMHAAAVEQNKRYNITGIGHYSFSEYKILPRSAADVELLSNVSISWGQHIGTYPSPFSNGIWIDNAQEAAQVLVFNLIGQQVLNVNLTGDARTFINTNELQSGVYLVTIVNDKGERTVRKMVKK
jgi:hypothetical protein